jgi:cysteinyl-tRNA synthetase
MSMKLLGETLDIHGGGLDLQFPHHENELAQSESFSGKPFARYWMHNGLLKLGTAKMAGSVGNVINVVDLLERHDPETVRFLLLSTHYRSPIEYSEERLQEVGRSLESFYRFFERYERILKTTYYTLQAPVTRGPFEAGGSEFLDEVARLRGDFLEQMDDDFNTGGAVGTLYRLLTVLNRFADVSELEKPNANNANKQSFRLAVGVLKELSQILGVFSRPPAVKESGSDTLVAGLMQLLIDLRAEARKAKNFAVADIIRKRLGDLGITLEDRTGGTGWRLD